MKLNDLDAVTGNLLQQTVIFITKAIQKKGTLAHSSTVLLAL
jgi:hypothetical protein